MGKDSNAAIAIVDETNFEKILPLISDYQIFYEATPQPQKNREHFSQFLRDHTKGLQFGAFNEEGRALGFATLYFIPASVDVGTACLMNDLFVIKESRGRGVAKKLLEACRNYSKQKGYKSLEWHTQVSNDTAQRLYDKLGAHRSSWYIYTLENK